MNMGDGVAGQEGTGLWCPRCRGPVPGPHHRPDVRRGAAMVSPGPPVLSRGQGLGWPRGGRQEVRS